MSSELQARSTAEDVAAQTFVYAYPLEYGLREIAGIAADSGMMPVGGPWNELHHVRDLIGPETKFVSPNNDTLYSVAPLDLRGGPLLLEVPEMGSRYYVLQLIDAWTNNFAYIGTRATGGESGRFLFVGPDHRSEDTEGAEVIEVPTNVALIVGRIQVDGTSDLDEVRALQDRFSLRPQDGSALPGQGLPQGDPGVPEELRWWETVRVELAAFPPPPADEPFLAAAARLGLTAEESPYVDADSELRETLREGEKRGREMIEELAKGNNLAPGEWTAATHFFDYNRHSLGPGTIDAPEWKIEDPKVAYATRAAAARAGLFGNHGYEANYDLVFTDADGTQLSGAHAYELHLPQPPPVRAFWSLTMYDVPDFVLVANPIDRYSIGDRTPGLEYGEDGSLTIYMQAESPGPGKESNWLPTPPGDFRPVMRMYWPDQPVLDGDYELPPIRRIG